MNSSDSHLMQLESSTQKIHPGLSGLPYVRCVTKGKAEYLYFDGQMVCSLHSTSRHHFKAAIDSFTTLRNAISSTLSPSTTCESSVWPPEGVLHY